MSKNILLFDLSNLIFYRYYSIKKYFNIKNEELHTPEFKQKFLEFDSIINKIRVKFKIKEIDNIYYLKDCLRSNIWRHKYIDNYKGNRKYNSEIGEYFKLAYENYFQDKNIIEENYVEADDICGVFVNYILDKNISYDNIYIFTSDLDYLQLKYNSNIHIYDMKLNNIVNKSLGNYNLDLKQKCIIGDKSDNISPIINRLNKKLLSEYINNDTLFQTMLNNNPIIKQKYELNCRMIDLNNIPSDLKLKIINKIKKYL
jgi:hypothetical protein